MGHSGSRHTGLRIANCCHHKVVEITQQRALAVSDDLSSHPLDDQLGRDFMHDLAWSTDFARENRRLMFDAMAEAFDRLLTTLEGAVVADYHNVSFINIHHNFAAIEDQAGQQVVVHRKGATQAFAGMMGLIPGSMGSASFVVRGKGNEDSPKSCSHGVGRRRGRKAAQREITEAAFAASLDGMYSKPSMTYVDEAPGAYKDISVVIGRQADLVDIVHTLKPFITVKGDSRAKED